jgi:alkylation response protein AidB-like acyl-CoA dehydrogenase
VTWHGPALGPEAAAVADLVASLPGGSRQELDDGHLCELAALRARLAELGLWTLGSQVENGGGGADRLTTVVALEALARRWPALAWASAQAQVAADVLGGDESFADLLGDLHAGRTAVAVVLAGARSLRIDYDRPDVTGWIDRVDTADAAPHLLIIDVGSAVLVRSSGLRGMQDCARTGLPGAVTRAMVIDARIGSTATVVAPVDSAAAAARLWIAAGAIAAGLSGAATDAAAGYAATRRQFGVSLAELPVLHRSLHVQAAQTAALLAVMTSADSARLDECAMLLAQAADTAIEVCSAALQIFGGYGYLSEYPAQGFLRDALSLRAAADAPGALAAAARLGA